MSGYSPGSECRRSGYDEYEGIFGPLTAGTVSFSGRQLRERGAFGSGIRRGGRAASRRHTRQSPPNFDRRAEYLAKRSDKRRSGERGEAAGLPAVDASQQVWLPSRSFAFRQRSGKLDTRAISRLDLDRIAATTDVETIQRHLENLAFADVTLDDVQQYSDAYFLKLFQIAQLTLEYLMHVQDSLVEHSESLESQCEQLLGECQHLEADNDKQEAEIAGLKREIRQKQRTMATLELMLLNASARKLPAGATSGLCVNSDKENASKGSNALVEELLASSAPDEGTGVHPVECVLCDKRFVSVEYLLRHQEKKHQRKHRRANSGSRKEQGRSSPSGSSGSSSSSDRRKSHQNSRRLPVESPPPLPKEILDALEEKNQLARQLVELQTQVRAEQEARDSQRRQIESQQTHLTATVMEHFGQLQSALTAIEKKQEAVKHDMIKHTDDAIKRMQEDAAEAERWSRQRFPSRIGALESDPEDSAVYPIGAAQVKSSGAERSQLEKVMDTFLRAQALKQQEIDTLQQENAKLASKAVKRKKQRRNQSELPSTLLAMAALDAARFGVDYGRTSVDMGADRAVKRPVVDEKTVQTDSEGVEGIVAPHSGLPVVRTDKAAIRDSTPRRSAIQVRPSRSSVSAKVDTVDPPTRVCDLPVAEVPASSQENGGKESKPGPSDCEGARTHMLVRVVGKAILRHLHLNRLSKRSTWQFQLPVSNLELALPRGKLAQVRRHHGDIVCVPVTRGMVANRLRWLIADALSSAGNRDSVQAFDWEEEDIDEVDGGNENIAMERIVLRHRSTGVEIQGEIVQVHLLVNELEAEILPPVKITPPPNPPAETQGGVRAMTRLQALTRGVLTRRKLQAMKSACNREVQQETPAAVALSDKSLEATAASQIDWTSSRLLLQREVVRRRLRVAVLSRLADIDDGDRAVSIVANERLVNDSIESNRPSASAVALCLAGVKAERTKLSDLERQRISQLETGASALAKDELELAAIDSGEADEQQLLQTARRRLDKLLSGVCTANPAEARGETSRSDRTLLNVLIDSIFPPVQPEALEARGSSEELASSPQRAPARRESSEIRALADAYEQSEAEFGIDQRATAQPATPTLSAARRAASASATEQPIMRLRHAERGVSVARAVPSSTAVGAAIVKSIGRPGTPTLEAVDGIDAERGSSPPDAPMPTSAMISPFSTTPLLSRRARRGSGFENAR